MQFSLQLDAPREALFAFLADPEQRKLWQSSIVSLTLLDEGLPRRGMRWRGQARGFGRFEMEISEYEENVLWAERGRSPRASMELSLRFAPGARAGTTSLGVALTLELHGMLRAARPFAPLALRPLMSSDLRRAARMVRKSSSLGASFI